MAKKCAMLCLDVQNLITNLEDSDSLTDNRLWCASTHLIWILSFLEELEKVHPENAISAQLGPLFVKSHKAFSHKHQPRRGYTIGTMISEGLKKLRLDNIASLINTSEMSSSTSQTISDALEIIEIQNIAEQIKASKPSRSASTPITREMVEFVDVLFNCLRDCIFFSSVLKKKLQYLQVFLISTAKLCIECESMKHLFNLAEDVAYTAAHLFVLGMVYSMENDNPSPLLDIEISKVVEMMSPLRPELRQIYVSVFIASKSSRSEATMNVQSMLHLFDGLQEDLEEMLGHDKLLGGDFLAWQMIRGGLSDLFGFLSDTINGHIPPEEFNSMQSHMEALAVETAIVIYSSCDKNMDHVPFLFQLTFSHVKLEVHLIAMLNSRTAIIAPLKDLIDSVREQLIFLRTFLMDSLEQFKEHTEITNLLTLIESVTRQAWSVVSSPSHDLEQEDLTWEVYHLYFPLLLKYKFIKAAIKQMCPKIAASLTPDHPVINLLNFLPINFEVTDSYFSMLKSSKTSSSDVPTIGEVLMGFHEYIFDNMLLKDETFLTFTVANEVKKFFYGLLVLVTYLFDPQVQTIGCMKQNDHLTGIGTIVTEAESASCLTYEDVAGSNKSRKVNLVLQFLTIAFKLIESEESLMDLLKQKETLEAQILDLIESAHEELVFLRAFLMDVLTQHTKLNDLHDLLMHAEVTAHKLAQISGSCNESFRDGSNTKKMKLSLSDLLREIESVKVEFRKLCFQLPDASPCNIADGEGLIDFLSNLQDMVLKNFGACSILSLKDQIPIVKDKLVYLVSFLADIVQYRNMYQELKDLVQCAQDIKYVCLFPIRDHRPAWYYMLYLSDVKQLLRFVEAEVEMICLKVPDSSNYRFPKTIGLGFLDCFLGNLEELLHAKVDLIINLQQQIGSAKDGLLCLRSLTAQFSENCDEHDEVYGVVTSVTEMAYKAEYVIDSCLACSHPIWYKVLWISEVVENIKLINRAVSETCERKKLDATVHKVKTTFTNLVPSLSANTPEADEELVGFQEALDKIKKQLHDKSPELDVASIVGMPGIGKTTLAKKIYNDEIATTHFNFHSKCHVTQVYSWRELLLTILKHVPGSADRTGKADRELASELHQFLLNKRFIILIDDVWDENIWDLFLMVFKGNTNGSRIILTTRLTKVARHAKLQSNPQRLRLFTNDESWTLLQEEVFPVGSCPLELEHVGLGIARSCGGLPLFLVLVAGVLKKKPKKADSWKEVEESLSSQDIGSLEKSMSVIEFSYKNLPHPLKPCFLYLGGFLKGKDIHVKKLIWLWQAEQFVESSYEKGPEAAAQDFLGDLISRNLIMGMEKRPNGKMKTCRIHDLLHTFCLKKAKQENFLLQINRFSGKDTFPEEPKEYRLFIHSDQDQIESWRPSSSNARSILFNAIDPDNLLWPRDVSFIFGSFKLVKVLDLGSVNIGSTFPITIEYLIHLRYFVAQTEAKSIPSSIVNLRNLEIFVVRRLGGEVILPCSLLKMVKLRHVHVNGFASFSLDEDMGESLLNSQLANLETFSTPHLSYGEDTEKILRKMPNLRKLSCIFSETFGFSERVMGKCVLFPKLRFLSHLESLKLVSNSYPTELPYEFDFPSKLRELTLSKFRLPWTQIWSIGELRNLEILKLHLRAFEGDQWEVKDSEFPKLKYLKLDNLNIKQWSLSENAFPKLEHLVIIKCRQLEEIPSHFEDDTPLKSIEVNWCSQELADSARQIQTSLHDYLGRCSFKVTIQPTEWIKSSS